MNEGRVSIARDFSALPGGAESADEFVDQLVPLLAASDRVVIDLDGVAALPASFLKQVFRSLVARHSVAAGDLPERVKLETSDPELEIYVSMADKFAREEADLAPA